VKTITEQLHKIIDEFEEDINRDRFATIVFRIKDWKVDEYEKNHKNKIKEININTTN